MGKYVKSTSTYVARKKVQNIDGGISIHERDWTTLGERHRLANGKQPIYGDGNFLFTRGSIKLPSRKNKTNTEVDVFKYDDVKDATSSVNNVELNTTTNDMRSFAYFGSCVDLIERTVSSIIKRFPGCLYTSNSTLSYVGEDDKYTPLVTDKGNTLYLLKNPFNIDILSKSITMDKIELPYKYMCESFNDYEIIFYKIVEDKVNNIKKIDSEDGKLLKDNILPINNFKVEYFFDENCTFIVDQWYNYPNYKAKQLKEGKSVAEAPVIITFTVDDPEDKKNPEKEIKIYGFRNEKEMVYLCETYGISIKPNDEIIENYYKTLQPLEKQLLNRNSNPLFKNVFLTPIENEGIGYTYAKRAYTWPNIYDYCIDIESVLYDEFIKKMLNLASSYDELWSNNLYGRMTHEAIKNFDWSYTQDYIEGDEEDNIQGGEQMKQIIYFIGHVFDKSKQYIDGIKSTNKVTQDSFLNMPDALLSDTLELHGWDVTSVIPKEVTKNNGIVSMDDYIKEHNLTWFKTSNDETPTTSNLDVKFMRRLLLSSKRIFQSKGTQESIEMIMGLFGLGKGTDKDYDLTEQWYEFTPWSYEKLNDLIVKKNETRADYADTIYSMGNAAGYYANLPINVLKKDGSKYIIPYYDRNIDYGNANDDFYFQSKGGWGCAMNSDTEGGFKEYLETVSYLRVLNSVNDLLNVRSIEVSEGDIYYVTDISEASIFFDSSKEDYSHFFYVREGFISTSRKDAWLNVDLSDKDNDITKRALYLNNIITSSFGNNPHVGFGNYDNGQAYIDYLKEPFKTFVGKGEVVYTTDEEKEKLTFATSLINETNEQKKIFNIMHEKSDEYVERVNTKQLIIENKHKTSDLYKSYFKSIILPYLMQVIPSTTILILKDF